MNQIKSKNDNFILFFYTQANKQTKWYPCDSYTVRLSGEKKNDENYQVCTLRSIDKRGNAIQSLSATYQLRGATKTGLFIRH